MKPELVRVDLATYQRLDLAVYHYPQKAVSIPVSEVSERVTTSLKLKLLTQFSVSNDVK